VLMIANVTIDIDNDTSDDTFALRVEVAGTQEGPYLTGWKDWRNGGCSVSICWALTGISGDTAFACQMISVGSRHVTLDTAIVRSFQVIEITNASLLVSKTSVDADAAEAGYTDIVGLTDTQTVTTGAVHLMMGNMPQTIQGDATFSIQMETGTTQLGPEAAAFTDTGSEGCGTSLMYLKSGLTGSTDFALRWDEIRGVVDADETAGNLRSFQVVEITSQVNLLTAQTSQAADLLTTSYTDVVGLTDTVTVDGTGSVLIFGACAVVEHSTDHCGAFRFYEDSTGEGPEITVGSDTTNEGCGHSVYWAATGKSSGSHNFALRGKEIADEDNTNVDMHEALNRSICILELTAAAVAVVLPSLVMAPSIAA